jgi:CubicO group peptidase (beta-lactamase class C family)
MPVTRRAFLSVGGAGLAAGSLLASLGCSRTTPAPASTDTTPTWDARIAEIERRIRQSMAAHQVPGVSIAVIRDARIAWTGTFGVRDRTTGVPVDDATVFSAQSMSKPVFAYRIMNCESRACSTSTCH